MKISLLQFAPVWLNPGANLHIIRDKCSQLTEETDLLLLPEMFNTGYVLNTKLLHVRWQTETLVQLQELASAYHVTMGGSIPMFRQGKWYNTFVFVDQSGLVLHYDKIHLFSLAGENEHYTPGSNTKIFDFKGLKILPLVCYDLRFPNLSFSTEIPDLIVYAANWPVSRVEHWKSLLTARAIENLAYVAGVNRVGYDQNGFEYPGYSCVIDYNGRVIAEMGETKGITTTSLDKIAMEHKRQRFGFLNDRKFKLNGHF